MPGHIEYWLIGFASTLYIRANILYSINLHARSLLLMLAHKYPPPLGFSIMLAARRPMLFRCFCRISIISGRRMP